MTRHLKKWAFKRMGIQKQHESITRTTSIKMNSEYISIIVAGVMKVVVFF